MTIKAIRMSPPFQGMRFSDLLLVECNRVAYPLLWLASWRDGRDDFPHRYFTF